MTLYLAYMDCWWRSTDRVDFLLGVCSITRFGLFFWLGCFPSPRIVWFFWPPRGVCITVEIGDLCQFYPPPPERLLGPSLLIPAPRGGAIYWERSMVS